MASVPTSTPLPSHMKEEKPQSKEDEATLTREFFEPHLRLHLNDLTDEGTSVFLSSISPSTLLPSAVSIVQKALYVQPKGEFHMPSTRSVTS
ncbi:hypothetical protein RRF57_008764 [Xylaria bambusicola]|uniref:Uncharacterized protein n=1 Tax=Xylaria bambusicola TaxID=326684 RepID=A0AAN7Z105_9PEZI